MTKPERNHTLSTGDTYLLYIIINKYRFKLRNKYFNIPRENVYAINETEDIIYALKFLESFLAEKTSIGCQKKYTLMFSKDIDEYINIPEEDRIVLPFIYSKYIIQCFEDEINEMALKFFRIGMYHPKPELFKEKKATLENFILGRIRVREHFEDINTLQDISINQKLTWHKSENRYNEFLKN